MKREYYVSYEFDVFNESNTKSKGVILRPFVTDSESEANNEFERITKTLEGMYGENLKVSAHAYRDGGGKIWIGKCKTNNHKHVVTFVIYEHEED